MPIEYMFCFIYSEQCIKPFRRAKSVAKKCSLFSSVFKKIIHNNTAPTFHEVGGIAYSLTFCRWHKNFSWYRVNLHKID